MDKDPITTIKISIQPHNIFKVLLTFDQQFQ